MYEIINLGNNRTVQLLELVEAIEEASGIEANKTHSAEIPGDVEQTWANVSKAKELLDYDPDFDLETGLTNFMKWDKDEKN
jgi:UDP-glucuronate 4-epimerase